MSEVMKIVLALTVSGTVLAGALALMRRLLKNRLPQALFYYLWLLVLLRLIVPVAVPLPQAWRAHQTEAQPVPIDPAPITQPVQNQLPPTTHQWEMVLPPEPVLNNGLPMPSVSVTPEVPAPVWHEQVWAFLCQWFTPIWLVGAAVHFLWFALSYLRFSHLLKENCTPLWEHEQALLDDLRGNQRVVACRSPLAGTPMLVGLLRHRIILPEEDINTRQLECILRHELTHLGRRDLLYKWFAVAATSLHWFNPLMPWLRREIARCCELSCDEAVVGTMDDRQKQWYGETLLALASLHALPRAVPATTLCEEKAQLRERLLGIMKYKKATAWILLLSCLLAVVVAGCAAVLGPQKPVEVEPDTPEKAPWVPAVSADTPVYHWLYWGDQSEMDLVIDEDGPKAYDYNGATLQESTLTQGERKKHTQPGFLTVGQLEAYQAIVDDWIADFLPLTDNDYHVLYTTDPADRLYYLEQSRSTWSLSLSDHTIQPAAGGWETGNYQGCFVVYEDGQAPSEDKRFWTLLPNDGSFPLAEETTLSGKVAVLTKDAPLENPSVETVDANGYTIMMDMAITLQKGELVYVESQQGETCTVSLLAGEPPHPRGQLPAHLLRADPDFLAQANQVILNDAPTFAAYEGKDFLGNRSGVAHVEMRSGQWLRVSLPGGAEPFWVKTDDLIWDWPLAEPLARWLPAGEERSLVYRWRYQERQGTPLTADLTCYDPADYGATAWEYDRDLQTMVSQPVERLSDLQRESSLRVEMLPGIVEGIKAWLDGSNAAWQQERWVSMGWVFPRMAFDSARDADCTYLVYDLNTGAVREMPEIYTGSRDYGAISLAIYTAQGSGGIYHLALDDTVVATLPETLSYADLQNYYMDFAVDWRVDFIPDFDWNSFSGTVSSQDFLMLTWSQNRDILPEDGSMTAALVEQVMKNQFGIESVQHESLFKTWDWDAKREIYLPVPQGVAGEGLFDTVAFSSTPYQGRTIYTVTLREYNYHFDYGGSYADLMAYVAREDRPYRENVQFLLDTKGEQLKSGQLTPEEAVRQLIREGNTSGFTKGTEIRLEYYMTENGPRFQYKSERAFDFTPGAVYENASMGFRLTLPACWEGKYRIQEQENSVRIDDAWGGTLCTIFRRDAAQFAADGGEDSIPVPYRVLGQNGQYVYLMYFASDVQYDPGNPEQTAAYLNMYQDLQDVPFEILGAAAPKGLLVHMRQLEDGRFFLLYDQPTEVQGGWLNITGFWVYDPRTGGLENIANVAMEGISPERVAVKGNTVLCSWEGKSMLQFLEKNGRWQMEILPRESEDRITIAPDHLRYAQREEETVILRDLTTHKELARLEGFRNINRMVWSPDGSKLAILSDHAFVTVWEPAAGTSIRYQGDYPEGWVNLKTVTFANNGKQLWMAYLCETTGAISIWDLETDSLTDTFYGEDLAVMDVRDSAVLYYRLDQKNLRSSLHIYDCRSGTSEIVGADVLYTAACFAGDTRTVLANQYDRAKLESRLTVLQAQGAGFDEAAAQTAVLAFLAKEYPEAKAPQVQPFVINDPSQLATLQMMTTETYTYDVNTGAIAPLRQAVPDSARLGGLFIRDESGQYRKEWMFLFTKEGPKAVTDNGTRLLQLSTRFPGAVVTDMELFVKDGLTVWSMVQLDDGDEAQTYNYSGALGAYELEKTSASARSAGKLPLSDLPGLLSAVAAWQAGHDTEHNAVNYNLSLQTNTRAVEIMLQQSWAGIAVYDLNSGTISQLEGDYEGSLAYGCITVLGPAKSPFWLYLIDDSAQ